MLENFYFKVFPIVLSSEYDPNKINDIVDSSQYLNGGHHVLNFPLMFWKAVLGYLRNHWCPD